MPNSSKVSFTQVDGTFSIEKDASSVYGVCGITEMGPVSSPNVAIIKTWEQFKRLYGDLISTSDFPLLCKIALEGGAALRVSRVAHYTTISDPSTLSADVATIASTFKTGTDSMFSFEMKYPGAAYNDVTVAVTAASNGNADYFNLTVTFAGKPYMDEVYQNLFIPGKPTVQDSSYLEVVAKNSRILTPVYYDLSAIAGSQLRPTNASKGFSSGTDGGTVVAADYSGDAAGKNGVYAFDEVSDCSLIALPEISTTSVLSAWAAYAANRKDLAVILHLDNSNTSEDAYVSDAEAIAGDTSFAALYGGGSKEFDPKTNSVRDVSEIGRVLAIAASVDSNYGPWFSMSNRKRSLVRGSYGVVNNYGTPGRATALNTLANAGINMLVEDNGQVFIKGNYTTQLANSQLSYLSVQRLLIYLTSKLRPVYEKYLDDPCDPVSWLSMYQEVQPLLESLKSPSARALYDYSYQGDQFVKDVDDVSINNAEDIQLGKYKVKLYLKAINPMVDLSVDITLTPTSVTFA